MTKPTDAEMIALLPCPFCGSAAIKENIEVNRHLSGNVVSCSNHNCPATPVTSGKECCKTWNTRASLTPTNAPEAGEICADQSANAQTTPFEPDYPNLVWEMYATTPEGEKVYCGSCDYARGANLLMDAMRERGFTDLSKNQVMRGNHGYSTLRRVQ